jgi:hypothetical protein
MSNVTIQVNLLKIALVVAGVAALILGGLALVIYMFNPPVDSSFISFLMLGSRSIFLKDLQPFVYFWLGFGTLLIVSPLFVKMPDEHRTRGSRKLAKLADAEQKTDVQEVVVTTTARPKTKLNTYTILLIISTAVIPFVVLTLFF